VKQAARSSLKVTSAGVDFAEVHPLFNQPVGHGTEYGARQIANGNPELRVKQMRMKPSEMLFSKD
jgi:hypothetical protein